MPSAEREWSLQKRLTSSWLERDLVMLNDELFFLAAWEVMTNFKVNDARRHWAHPSIDFVFLDRGGRMVLLELKREVRTPRDAWSVLCQVTHRAHALAAHFSHAKLEDVYFDCHAGMDGRASPAVSVAPLVEAHARAFRQPPLSELPGLPVRRFVMAKEYGPALVGALASMNNDTEQQVKATLSRYKLRGEIKRYLELPEDPQAVGSAIQAVTVNGATWPPS